MGFPSTALKSSIRNIVGENANEVKEENILK